MVYRARDKRTDEIVALKRLKMEKEKEGFPITSLREINTLLKAQHPNIVTVREIVVGSNMDKIFIVMDYVEHDLKSLIETMKQKKQVFIPGEYFCFIMLMKYDTSLFTALFIMYITVYVFICHICQFLYQLYVNKVIIIKVIVM